MAARIETIMTTVMITVTTVDGNDKVIGTKTTPTMMTAVVTAIMTAIMAKRMMNRAIDHNNYNDPQKLPELPELHQQTNNKNSPPEPCALAVIAVLGISGTRGSNLDWVPPHRNNYRTWARS